MTSKDTATLPYPRRRGTERILGKIGRHHFAFFKGYLEGLDIAQLAHRYLETAETSNIHLRTVEATVKWIRQDLKLLAKRHGKHAVARIIDVSPAKINPPSPSVPTLEEFREEHDPHEMYSEKDLLALFEDTYSGGISEQKRIRNARLRKRQAEALAWLQMKTNVSPRPSDLLEAWLLEYLVKQFKKVDILTVSELATYVKANGPLWYKDVPRLGEVTAARISKWLWLYRDEIGTDVTVYDARAIRLIQFGLVPFEYFSPPTHLSGEIGSNRGDRNGSGANNDREAIVLWLQKLKDEDTTRSYRKEAERFFLWATIERDKPLSSITTADCLAYQKFLNDLGRVSDDYWNQTFRISQDSWMSDKKYERDSTNWRPFLSPFSIDAEGVKTRKRHQALQPASQKQALVIIRGMFRWMVKTGYLHTNPWDSASIPADRNKIDVSRSFTKEQWKIIRDEALSLPPSPAGARLRFIVMFSYLTGLRLHELARAKVSDILEETSITGGRRYFKMNVLGKGKKLREIPVPQVLIDELERYLRSRSIESLKAAPVDAPLVERIRGTSNPEAKKLKAQLEHPDRYEHDPSFVDEYLSRDAIYKLLKTFFQSLMLRFPGGSTDRAKFQAASTHWIRHTYATHALGNKVPLETVKNNMGHASVDTTSMYLDNDIAERAEHMENFADQLYK